MKNLLAILLILLPLCTFGQSRKSEKLYKQGLELLEAKQFEEAIPYFQKCDSLDKAKLAPESENYYRAELKLTDCYEGLVAKKVSEGNSSEAMAFQTLAVEIRKRILGEEHQYYAKALSELACLNAEMGNLTDAIEIETHAIEIFRKTVGEGHSDYATSLSNLCGYYYYSGDNAESIRLGNIAVETLKKTLGEEHPNYASALNNLALSYYNIGNYAEAVRLGTISMNIRKKILGEDHPSYAISLNNLAGLNYTMGNYEEAIRLGTLSMEILKKNVGEEHPDYAVSLNSLAIFYAKMHKYAEAIRLETNAMEIYLKNFGKGHPRYAYLLKSLANYNFLAGNFEESVTYFEKSYERVASFILRYFSSMTNKERANYWNIYSDYFSGDLAYVAFKSGNRDMTALAYNGQVFSKGLILNSELEIQKLIEQSGDTTFANRYYKIKNDRAMLDELYQHPMEERPMDADSLSIIIEKEERQLVQSSKELGDYTKKLSIDWHDIQKELKDNDLAVEFACIKDTAAKQLIYLAFALKKGMASPEIVKLFELDDFYDISSVDYYSTPKLYNLVWKPLSKYFNGVKKVYFSPTGQFHRIGIEYLPDENGMIFAEKFDAYRLSSTRELALEKEVNPSKKAATYGGIRFDVDADSTDVKRSGGAVYLGGTKIESTAVAELLRAAQYNVTALSDTLATEESFKNLSGKNLKILHIGTHGFYMSEDDMENSGYKFYTSNQQSDEDKVLSYSGLLFAGANSAIDPSTRSAIRDGADDGVLTAKEISRLDFKGLDLVVLSACGTGLGKVTGEGVFGLQRGFKKAGAQAIIMSLWEVADESTQLLMIEFFKNLTVGQSKRAAFAAAQKKVRAKYHNPLHWAAFVMVDGME